MTYLLTFSPFFLQTKAEEQGLEPGELVKLSQAELSMRLGTDASMGNWKKSKTKGKVSMDGFVYLNFVEGIL